MHPFLDNNPPKPAVSSETPPVLTPEDYAKARESYLQALKLDPAAALEGIATGAFYNNKIQHIDLKGVKNIGNSAFDKNPLTLISIGDNINEENDPPFEPNTFGIFGESFVTAYMGNGRKGGIYFYDAPSGTWKYEGNYDNWEIHLEHGAKLNPGAQFCSSCGAKISAAPAPASARRFIILCTAVPGIIGIFAGGFFGSVIMAFFGFGMGSLVRKKHNRQILASPQGKVFGKKR